MLKRGAGLAASFAVALAAMRYASPSTPIEVSPAVVLPSETAAFAQTFTPTQQEIDAADLAGYVGGCTAYLPTDPARAYPGDGNRGKAKKVVDSFFSLDSPSDLPATVTYAVALAPDPIHTNLSLPFDREIVLIQQAAHDSGYSYDSAWMPWRRNESREVATIAGRQFASTLADQRENCPGIMLFRKETPRVTRTNRRTMDTPGHSSSLSSANNRPAASTRCNGPTPSTGSS